MTPDGWKLVPVEPTPEMLTAGSYAVDLHSHSPIGVWAAMLYAAPAAPQAEPQREPLSDEQIAEITKKAARRSALRHDRSTSARIARAVERAHGIGGSDE